MKGFYYLVGLISGAIIGSIVTYNLMKVEYEEIPIDLSDKEEPKKEEPAKDPEQEEAELEKRAQQRYEELVKKYGYDQDENESDNDPYEISPDEFDDEYEYEKISLTYYSDGILADDVGDPMDDDDIMASVGLNFESYFSDTKCNAVYIRNDQRNCDYEILRDLEPFEEYYKKARYRVK